MKKKPLQVQLPVKLFARFKLKCKRVDLSMRQVITRLVLEWVSK